MAEPILVIDLEAPFAGRESVDEWWMSELADHIYATCPALVRSRPPIKRGQGRLYPEAGDVCGICVRWWRARKTKAVDAAASAGPEEETTDGAG